MCSGLVEFGQRAGVRLYTIANLVLGCRVRFQYLLYTYSVEFASLPTEFDVTLFTFSARFHLQWHSIERNLLSFKKINDRSNEVAVDFFIVLSCCWETAVIVGEVIVNYKRFFLCCYDLLKVLDRKILVDWHNSRIRTKLLNRSVHLSVYLGAFCMFEL